MSSGQRPDPGAIDATAAAARRACQLGAAMTLLLSAGLAAAQSTPVPVPTGPGGGAPIYVQPAPTTRVPGQTETPDPVPSPADAAAKPLPTAPAPSQPGKATPPRQLTAFPEMTRGLGNSEALLGR